MNNFSRFEKWYSAHVIDNHKEKITVKIKNSTDYGWEVSVDFRKTSYKHLKNLYESKKISNYNYYTVKAEGKEFIAKGDFTKLDFLLGKFLYYIGNSEIYDYEKDFFMSPDIQNFIFEDGDNDFIFLHYTPEEGTARKIIETGFRFITFDKTTTKIRNDVIDLSYNHIIRKPFGKNVVVIRISKKLYEKYLPLINKNPNKFLKTEEVLIKEKKYNGEREEFLYTLHNKYIKGFFNYTTGIIVKNPEFDSGFDSDNFIKNINLNL